MKDRLVETHARDGHTYEMWSQPSFGWRRGGRQDRTVYKMDGKRIARDAYKAAIGELVTIVERATCQICERRIGVKVGVIAHHGYERPEGWHSQTASCYGARRLSFEVDRTALGEYIDNAKYQLTHLDETVAEMRTAPSKVLVRPSGHRGGRFVEAQYCEPGEPNYATHQGRWFQHMARQREMIDSDIAHQQARYDAWAPAADKLSA